jgi:cytoskeletal protein CcmA (bactofilin family)
VITGKITGSEDLEIDGQVMGVIDLPAHTLTLGPNARIEAPVSAKSVVVHGRVTGNITAEDKIDLRNSGSVEGDLFAPKVAIAEGAQFRGSITMKQNLQPAEKPLDIFASVGVPGTDASGEKKTVS